MGSCSEGTQPRPQHLGMRQCQTGRPTSNITDLERLKPSRPSKHASSRRGVIIFSIISVMTVKVGSTMKSMNPVAIPTQNCIYTDTFSVQPFSGLNYVPSAYQSGTGPPLWTGGHKEGKRGDPALLLCHPEKVELFKVISSLPNEKYPQLHIRTYMMSSVLFLLIIKKTPHKLISLGRYCRSSGALIHPDTQIMASLE